MALDSSIVELLSVGHGAGCGSDDDELWRTEWWLGRLRWATARVAAEFDSVTLKAFEMHVLAACPVAETAAKLGISKWRIYRARRKKSSHGAFSAQNAPPRPGRDPGDHLLHHRRTEHEEQRTSRGSPERNV